jgi:hypothetical protein
LLKKLLSDKYDNGKNCDKRIVTRVKFLARYYFAHWTDDGEAFIVERVPITHKHLPKIGRGNKMNLTCYLSRLFFESIKK